MSNPDPKSVLSKRLGIDSSGDAPVQNGKSILQTLGGPIGILESLVPGTVYVTLFSLTLNVLVSATAAASVALVFAVIQLVRKRPLTQVFAGLAGLAISVWLPLRDGINDAHAADYFVPGLVTNLVYLVVLSLSIIFRYPLIGAVLGFLSGKGSAWRDDRQLFVRYRWITLMWVGMFSIRLAVQVPLYLTQQVAALGVAKLVLGTPLYALVIWFTWLAARDTLRSSK